VVIGFIVLIIVFDTQYLICCFGTEIVTLAVLSTVSSKVNLRCKHPSFFIFICPLLFYHFLFTSALLSLCCPCFPRDVFFTLRASRHGQLRSKVRVHLLAIRTKMVPALFFPPLPPSLWSRIQRATTMQIPASPARPLMVTVPFYPKRGPWSGRP